MPRYLQRLFTWAADRGTHPLRRQVDRLGAPDRDALEYACRIADQQQHVMIGVPHLLVALIESSLALRQSLERQGVDPFQVTAKAQMRLQALTKLLAHGSPSFSPEVVAMLATAAREGARPADGSELFWAIVECPRARDAAVEIAPELGSLQCPREP